MDAITARLIVKAATRDNPEMKEALEFLFDERIKLGEYFERQALSGSKSDQGKAGGRPAWPHWDLVPKLDAEIPSHIKAKTHRAQIIRRRLIELDYREIPTIKKIAASLPNK